MSLHASSLLGGRWSSGASFSDTTFTVDLLNPSEMLEEIISPPKLLLQKTCGSLQRILVLIASCSWNKLATKPIQRFADILELNSHSWSIRYILTCLILYKGFALTMAKSLVRFALGSASLHLFPYLLVRRSVAKILDCVLYFPLGQDVLD